MSRKRINTGIYCIENKVNAKRYVGKAYNVERRLYEHEYHLKRGTDKCAVLQRAFNKYGFINFEFYILEACEPEEMNDREIYWISFLQTNDKRYGYNVSNGGSQSLLGHKFPPEFGRKISAMKKGSKLTEEHKIKISRSQKGKIVSEETKRKISEARSGEKHYFWGKTHSEETKKKIGNSHSGTKAYQFGRKTPGSSSKYFGVTFTNSKGRIYWKASVKIHGTRIYIGSSKIEEEAARMYDAYVIENNLPNPLNFPEEAK